MSIIYTPIGATSPSPSTTAPAEGEQTANPQGTTAGTKPAAADAGRAKQPKDDTAFGLKFINYAQLGVDLGLQVVRTVTEILPATDLTQTNGVDDPATPSVFLDVRLPTIVNYNSYATDDTRNWMAMLNGGTMFLRAGNNLVFPMVRSFESLDDATSLSDSPLARLQMGGEPVLGDNVTKDLNTWLITGISPITGSWGDTFAARSQMAVTEHGIFGMGDPKNPTKAHNWNSALNIGLATLMGMGSMSNISVYDAARKRAQGAYAATETDISEIRTQLGDAADSYTDEELANMIEAAQSYAGSTDPEAFNTWWYNKYGEAITAEQMLQNMAAIGAQKINSEPFVTIGDFLAARTISGNVTAMGNEALLRSHAVNQMIIDNKGEGENSWGKVGIMVLLAGGQIALNEGARMVYQALHDNDPENEGEVNPYNFIDQDGNVNTASIANITTQLGSVPLALAANLTAHPDTMAQNFGENIAQINDAIFSPPIHYAIAQHGNPLSEHYNETKGGNNNTTFYFAESAVGAGAQFFYGFHQGRALKEAKESGNAAYVLPAAIGALAMGAKYIHYAALSQPEDDVRRDLEAHGYDTDNIMSNDMKDVGPILLAAPAVGWGIGMIAGYAGTKGINNKPGDDAAVKVSLSGPSGSVAGASASINLSGLGNRGSSRPVAQPVG